MWEEWDICKARSSTRRFSTSFPGISFLRRPSSRKFRAESAMESVAVMVLLPFQETIENPDLHGESFCFYQHNERYRANLIEPLCLKLCLGRNTSDITDSHHAALTRLLLIHRENALRSAYSSFLRPRMVGISPGSAPRRDETNSLCAIIVQSRDIPFD